MVDEALSTINWLHMACQKRAAERERCYQVVYQAMLATEEPAVLEALKSIAYEIVDPQRAR